MKKTLVLLSAWIFSVGVFAQQAREEMKKDRNLSADNYVAYPGPQKP